jgi:nucleoside phosphorylase
VTVATTLSVTTDEALSALIRASTDADVEHLEAQSVAAACAELGVPAAIVLGVANAVGAGSHAEWRANHARVSASVGDVVLGALRAPLRLLEAADERSGRRDREPVERCAGRGRAARR